MQWYNSMYYACILMRKEAFDVEVRHRLHIEVYCVMKQYHVFTFVMLIMLTNHQHLVVDIGLHLFPF
jgi:hypothetical protein